MSGQNRSSVNATAQVVRNREGVLLRYCADVPLQGQRRIQPSDRERMTLIAAEREILVLRIVVDHLELSDIGLVRVYRSLNTVQRGLEMVRSHLGLRRP